MKFLLQQGWGMLALNAELLGKRVGSGVILSPRVLEPPRLKEHAEEVRAAGGSVLFDPQFYAPRTGHQRIFLYPYWEGLSYDTDTFDDPTAREVCKRVVDFQVSELGVDEIIAPGMYTNAADDHWRECQSRFAEVAASVGAGRPTYSTLAIGPDVVRNRERFDPVIDEALNYPTSGVYVLLKLPSSFLVSDEVYLYAVLDAFLSFREAGKEVLVGYANQQALIYASVGVRTIASGNFRNVRSFDPQIFDQQDEDDRRRATWYYDADTLGEFRIERLGLAYRRGLKGSFGPACPFCESLLSADDPTSVNWTEGMAFRHFLSELDRQWLAFSGVKANERIATV